jgi:hypothetical protein
MGGSYESREPDAKQAFTHSHGEDGHHHHGDGHSHGHDH